LALFRFSQSVGLLERGEAEALRRTARETGQRPIDILAQRFDSDRIAELLTEHLGLPLIDLSVVSIQQEALRCLSRDLAKRYDAMPIRLDRGRVVVAFANPLDTEGIKAVEFSARSKVEVVVASLPQVRASIQHHFYFDDEINTMLAGSIPGGGVEVEQVAREEEAQNLLGEGKDKATVIRLVELLLVDGLRLGASDIHIEPSAESTVVRYRINGVLERGVVIPKALQVQVVARIKVMASLDITERRRPQDGGIRVSFEERKADVRVSVLPTQFGEKVVLRLLDPTAKGHGIDSLGLDPDLLEILRAEIRRPEGMILISGPTGSGKSTTAHAILRDIADARLNIVTIENPIEHRLPGVSQVEVNEKQGLGFAETLRSILRQDPDVIFVGEIRDAETASIALRAAQTGHLVLSTVHTIDATASITRLLDLGIEPTLISASLRLVIAQRLVRTLCARCIRPSAAPSSLDRSRLRRHGTELTSVASAAGCQACRETGYRSRVGVFEVLPVSRRLRAMIERQEGETVLRAQVRAEGVRSMPAAALAAVNAGRTTVDEVLRVVPPEESSSDAAIDDELGAADESRPAAPATAPPPAPASEPVPVAGPFRILVVDDDPLLVNITATTLGRSPLPLEPVTATDGAGALQRLDEGSIHLALLDVGLPDFSGFVLCEKIRAHPRCGGVPIFMLTGRGDVGAKAEAFRAGADDYLVKPFVSAELVLRVLRALERHYGAKLPDATAGDAPWPFASGAEDAPAKASARDVEPPPPLPRPAPPPANPFARGADTPAPVRAGGDAWSKFLGRARTTS
jgi:type IV pilus assembly protein PilB